MFQKKININKNLKKLIIMSVLIKCYLKKLESFEGKEYDILVDKAVFSLIASNGDAGKEMLDAYYWVLEHKCLTTRSKMLDFIDRVRVNYIK